MCTIGQLEQKTGAAVTGKMLFIPDLFHPCEYLRIFIYFFIEKTDEWQA